MSLELFNLLNSISLLLNKFFQLLLTFSRVFEKCICYLLALCLRTARGKSFFSSHVLYSSTVDTQHSGDTRSPKALNVRDLQGIFRGLDSQGTNRKTDDLMKKLFFRSNSFCITYLHLFFTETASLQKF